MLLPLLHLAAARVRRRPRLLGRKLAAAWEGSNQRHQLLLNPASSRGSNRHGLRLRRNLLVAKQSIRQTQQLLLKLVLRRANSS